MFSDYKAYFLIVWKLSPAPSVKSKIFTPFSGNTLMTPFKKPLLSPRYNAAQGYSTVQATHYELGDS